MYKCLLLCAAISAASAGILSRGLVGGLGFGRTLGLAGGYGGLGLAGGYGGLGLATGYGGLGLKGGIGGLGLATGYGGLGLAGGYGGPIAVNAAINSRRSYHVVPVPTTYDAPIPTVVEVDAPVQPVHFVFRSQSSPISVQQIHTPNLTPYYEATRSEDAPHHLRHDNYKPVIQELREVIQPFRRVVQEILPVQEEIKTIVAKGEGLNRAALPLAAPVAPLGLLNKGALFAGKVY